MPLYDRDYVRERVFGDGPRLGSRLGSCNTWLIIINVAIFVLQALTPITRYGYFSTEKVTLQGGLEFWRFLTFQFLHAGPMHLLFNMFGLYMFGPLVESHLGRKRYLAFYLTCGVCGALAYLLLNAGGVLAAYMGNLNIPGLIYNSPSAPLIGASAGVFGVILACAYVAPNLVVQLLFPPIPLRMRTLAYAYVAIAAATVIFGGQNAGGEAAHLGGAAAGYILIRRAYLLRDFFDILSDSRSVRKRSGLAPPPRSRSDEDEIELDRILAKVRSDGLHSLTEDERATLRRITNQKRSGGAA
jgi:membrane associated rhomboid family serine protease